MELPAGGACGCGSGSPSTAAVALAPKGSMPRCTRRCAVTSDLSRPQDIATRWRMASGLVRNAVGALGAYCAASSSPTVLRGILPREGNAEGSAVTREAFQLQARVEQLAKMLHNGKSYAFAGLVGAPALLRRLRPAASLCRCGGFAGNRMRLSRRCAENLCQRTRSVVSETNARILHEQHPAGDLPVYLRA